MECQKALSYRRPCSHLGDSQEQEGLVLTTLLILLGLVLLLDYLHSPTQPHAAE